LKIPLAQWAEKLSGITWLEGQGTLSDKALRVKKLVKALAPLAGVESRDLEQAALLAKADLATNMVREKEFNSLQGVMGGLYAKAQGLSVETARAIGEHYRPRWAGDDLPSGPEGSILSVADKLDTLAGCFKAGLIPTGSQDPFALRRQGLGVLLIVLKNRWNVSLSDLVAKALAGYGGGRSAKWTDEIEEFLRGRLQSLLEGRDLAYDAIAAVLSAPGESLVSMVERVETVSRLKGSAEFQELSTAAGRVLRILPEKLPPPKPSKALLKLPEETVLFAAVQGASGGLKSAADAGHWDDAVGHLVALTPAVHAFFEKILVMDKDPGIKRNRLALLSLAAGLYLTVCDFRKLVTPAENQAKPS
jgi:glycyl-tRNA synthetase beta chain